MWLLFFNVGQYLIAFFSVFGGVGCKLCIAAEACGILLISSDINSPPLLQKSL
jgi:hypothetical protein